MKNNPDYSAVMIGGCKDKEENAKRIEEKGSLLEELTKHEGYFEVSLILEDSYHLFKEALDCYSTCAYMATALLCRSTVESAIYNLAIADSLEWDKSKLDIPKIDKFNISNSYNYLDRYRKSLKEVRLKYPNLIKSNDEKLSKIRENGNLFAHYSSIITKSILEHVKDPIRLTITNEEAKVLLRYTLDFLEDTMKTLMKTG